MTTHAFPASAGDALLERFEAAWQRGPSPSLEEFAPAARQAGGTALLTDLVKIDLEYRWRKGMAIAAGSAGPPRLEDYLARYPDLGAAEGRLLELIGDEYRVRCCWGDRPAPAEYPRRFPRQAAALPARLGQVAAELAAELRGAAMPTHRSSPPTTPAAPQSAAQLVAAILQHQLLPAVQAQALPALDRPGSDARALARDLVERGWLTPYQANQLLLGRGSDLVLDQYVVLERLGEGGTGQVFKARHRHIRRLAAVKVIRRDLLSDAEVLGRFAREIRVLSQMSHPNIVHAYDAGAVGDTHYLAMEYAEGVDLGKLVKRAGPLPVAQACACIRQAALGLQHAHDKGLVHRDIKPQNLLLAQQTGADGLVKVLDLGLARLQRRPDMAQAPAADEVTGLTPAGAVMIGTTDYLAPEQAIDFHTADIRADIYSLGCTFFYLLLGKAPFTGGSLTNKLLQHQQAPRPDVHLLRPDVPPAVARIVQRMMAQRPEDRIQTPGEVAEALARVSNVGEQPAVGKVQRWQSYLPQSRKHWALAGGTVLLMLFALLFLVWPERTAPLVLLDPQAIPASKRPAQPVAGLVAILGDAGGAEMPVLAFSADGGLLAAASGRDIRLWNLATRAPRELPPLTGHQQPPTALAWAPNQPTLASSGDPTIRLWDVSGGRGRERAVLKDYAKPIRAVAFSPDGRLLAAVSIEEPVVRMWDVTAAKPTRKSDVLAAGDRLAFAPSGKLLGIGRTQPSSLRLADRDSHDWKLRDSSYSYGSSQRYMGFTAVDQYLVASEQDGQLTVYSPGAVNVSLPYRNTPLAFTPDHQHMALAEGGPALAIWDLAAKKRRHEAQLPQALVGLAFAPDGRHLAVSLADGTVYVLRLGFLATP